MLIGAEPLPPEFAAALAVTSERRGPIGDPVWYFSETTSTNDRAADAAERGVAEGATVIASAQTAGRGRMGRTWHSPAGAGVYASIVFRNPRVAGLLTLAGAVGVAEGIQAATALPVEIKWPNDVVIAAGLAPRRLKIAGILAEASTGAEGLQHVILGFGINVRAATFPPEIVRTATDIETELGRTVEPGVVLAETLAALNVHVQHLARGDVAMVLNRWRALAPMALGSTVEWERNGHWRRGTTAGIDESGALLVQTDTGLERILAGEVTWR